MRITKTLSIKLFDSKNDKLIWSPRLLVLGGYDKGVITIKWLISKCNEGYNSKITIFTASGLAENFEDCDNIHHYNRLYSLVENYKNSKKMHITKIIVIMFNGYSQMKELMSTSAVMWLLRNGKHFNISLIVHVSYADSFIPAGMKHHFDYILFDTPIPVQYIKKIWKDHGAYFRNQDYFYGITKQYITSPYIQSNALEKEIFDILYPHIGRDISTLIIQKYCKQGTGLIIKQYFDKFNTNTDLDENVIKEHIEYYASPRLFK